MAKNPRQDKTAHELRQQIAHSRDRLARDLDGLRYELDFPLKFRKSFQRRAPIWIAAAVLTGVVVTARASTKKTVYVSGKNREHVKGKEQKKGLLQAGLAMAILKFAATLLRPMVIRLVTQKLGAYGRGPAPKW